MIKIIQNQKENVMSKKVEFNQLKKAYENDGSDYMTREWHGIKIKVKCRMSFEDVSNIIFMVLSNVFDEESNELVPMARQLAVRLGIIETMTDIAIPKDVESQYELAYLPGLYDAIIASIERDQYSDLMESIAEKIYNIESFSFKHEQRRIEEIARSLSEFEDQYRDMFDGITAEDVSGVISAVANGVIDEEKLVSAYMKNK